MADFALFEGTLHFTESAILETGATFSAESTGWLIRKPHDIPHEVGGSLIGEDGLVLMAGAELVEWYQTHQTQGFHVFDAIPFSPFQSLL